MFIAVCVTIKVLEWIKISEKPFSFISYKHWWINLFIFIYIYVYQLFSSFKSLLPKIWKSFKYNKKVFIKQSSYDLHSHGADNKTPKCITDPVAHSGCIQKSSALLPLIYLLVSKVQFCIFTTKNKIWSEVWYCTWAIDGQQMVQNNVQVFWLGLVQKIL